MTPITAHGTAKSSKTQPNNAPPPKNEVEALAERLGIYKKKLTEATAPHDAPAPPDARAVEIGTGNKQPRKAATKDGKYTAAPLDAPGRSNDGNKSSWYSETELELYERALPADEL